MLCINWFEDNGNLLQYEKFDRESYFKMNNLKSLSFNYVFESLRII